MLHNTNTPAANEPVRRKPPVSQTDRRPSAPTDTTAGEGHALSPLATSLVEFDGRMVRPYYTRFGVLLLLPPMVPVWPDASDDILTLCYPRVVSGTHENGIIFDPPSEQYEVRRDGQVEYFNYTIDPCIRAAVRLKVPVIPASRESAPLLDAQAAIQAEEVCADDQPAESPEVVTIDLLPTAAATVLEKRIQCRDEKAFNGEAHKRGMDFNAPPVIRDAINLYFRDKLGSDWRGIKSRRELTEAEWAELLLALRQGVWNQSWKQLLFKTKKVAA